MSATSKISKSSLVNSLAKRYDPRTIQNQGPTNVQKPSQTPVVSKTPTSISIMDTKLDFLNQKIDTILVEQNNAFEKLENVSQDIVDIEKDLQEIKKESTKAEKTNEILEDKDIFLEMKGHFVEMISHLSSINKYSEEQAKRLDGVEKILLGTQSVIHFLMKQIKLSTVFEFLQRKQNLTKPPLVNSKINKQERKENIKEKGKNSAKGVETNRKKDTHLNKRNKKFINDQITSEQKKNVPLSLKGTKSLKKKKPPDAEKTVKKFSKKKKQKEQNILLSIVSVEEYFPERSVQKTHYRKHKEKVQKLNRENKEASVILVENKSPEIKYEENFISIDIPNSHIKTHVQDGSPIIFSVEECEEPMPATEEPVQALPEVSEKAVDTGESFTDVQKDKGEKEIVILVTEDAPHIETENKYEEDEGKHEALDEQEDDDSIHNITDCEEIKAVQDSTESIASEGSKQTVSGTDTCDHLSVCPAYADTELETTCTFLTKSGENEEDVPTLSTEEEEETEEEEDEIEEETVEECSQNGDICYNDQGCNSKRRVTDQQHTKEDSKKSRLDTKDTEESTTSQDTEEKPNDLIINKEAQACECAEENKEQSSIKEEEELLILDVTPPPPAPFDHRIVSAKHAQINNFYTVEKTQVLGGGRFGQVYRCVEKSSGLTLAAKIIKVKGHKQKEETKNEIQVMNQLNHANLIQLYDAFESRNDIILVMEYIDGGELFDRIIDENCNLSEVDTILFIKQICEGIQFMHQMYIIHLDLKPENIMCVSRADYQIKIIDFGLARRYKPREKLKVHFGTPEFLAPEVVNYDFVSFPTDMWSVGVIAYMLLSGLSPFLGEDDNETLNNIVVSQFDFEGDEFQSISESAKEFISKLLIKEKCWRMSATEALKHPWLSDSRLHYRISQQVSEMRKMQSCSVSEAPVSQ